MSFKPIAFTERYIPGLVIKKIQENCEKLSRENSFPLPLQYWKQKFVGDSTIITGLNKRSRKAITESSVTKIDDKYIAILVCIKSGDWKIDKLIWGINH